MSRRASARPKTRAPREMPIVRYVREDVLLVRDWDTKWARAMVLRGWSWEQLAVRAGCSRIRVRKWAVARSLTVGAFERVVALFGLPRSYWTDELPPVPRVHRSRAAEVLLGRRPSRVAARANR